jgi:hypothetical protein
MRHIGQREFTHQGLGTSDQLLRFEFGFVLPAVYEHLTRVSQITVGRDNRPPSIPSVLRASSFRRRNVQV